MRMRAEVRDDVWTLVTSKPNKNAQSLDATPNGLLVELVSSDHGEDATTLIPWELLEELVGYWQSEMETPE